MVVRWNKDIQQCTTPDNPVVTQVCREARSEALQNLRPPFCATERLDSGTIIWFNRAMDTVSVDWKSFAQGHGTPGIISREFSMPMEADNIKSLQVHCDELRHYMRESMLQSKDYLRNLEKLHVVGCDETESQPLPLTSHDIAGIGNRTYPELNCDLNVNGSFCAVHFWFKDWNTQRSHQKKEWAHRFNDLYGISLRRYQSRIASRRFRQRRLAKRREMLVE